ncbi:hypothetical protein L2E82_25981 [Cichorium intybus]|uniref:Uncharacterized protein n=1 Tax=Cichorium intybus TaxID=13427 RepID=A0ACB9E557_CICIN|nr:hypothetical protein L2E82_25981 [Cichorium intybus]
MIRKSKRLTMSKNRGHKQHKIKHIDHISNLPDCILHHILSFMPTKEVVKTSVLSTRWKSLWASAPNIDFDDTLFSDTNIDLYDAFIWDTKNHDQHLPDVTSFMNFLERVLMLRGSSNIEKFRLTCFNSYDESQIQRSQIHSWISSAITHNVQDLHLTFFQDDPSVIPWSTFDGTSLVSLKIRANSVTELPSCISFPCLKTLHLLSVVFPNNDHAEKLFLGCPVLEELVLSDNWMNLKNIVISSSTLKSLTIDDWEPFQPLNDPTSACKIKIDASNLTYFDYTGYLSNEILLNNASSLVKACIHIPSEWPKGVGCRVIDLLKQLRYVVSLRLSSCALECLKFADKMPARFTVFSNLSHLTLTLKIGNYSFGALMDFLHVCPILQSICLSEGFKKCMHLGENDPVLLSIPLCMSNCLKTLTFKKLHAYNSEICFLKCVLKYAHVLEKMDISCSKNWFPFVKDKSETTVCHQNSCRSDPIDKDKDKA